MESVCVKYDSLVFEVNYYTELLGVLGILSDDQDAICDAGAEWGNSIYRNQVLEFFSKFKNHKAVKWLEILSNQYNFNYDAPVNLVLLMYYGLEIDPNKFDVRNHQC